MPHFDENYSNNELNLENSKLKISDAFLQKVKGEFSVLFVGKNGEVRTD